MSTAPSVRLRVELGRLDPRRGTAPRSRPSTGSIQILAMASGFVDRDLFDLDAALGRQHAEVLLGGAVEGEGGVVLLGDVGRLLDPQAAHDVALDVEAEDVVGVRAGLVGVGGELDAAGLAPTAHVHLGLDHHRVAEPLGGGDGLVHGERHLTGRDRDAVAREELLALVFEEVHRAPVWWRLACEQGLPVAEHVSDPPGAGACCALVADHNWRRGVHPRGPQADLDHRWRGRGGRPALRRRDRVRGPEREAVDTRTGARSTSATPPTSARSWPCSPLYFASPFGDASFWLDKEDGQMVALNVTLPDTKSCNVIWRGPGQHLPRLQRRRHRQGWRWAGIR